MVYTTTVLAAILLLITHSQHLARATPTSVQASGESSCSLQCLPCMPLGCCQVNDEGQFPVPIHTFEIKFLNSKDAVHAASKISEDGTHHEYLIVNIIKSSPLFGSRNTLLISTDDDQYFNPKKMIGTDMDRPETLWSKNAMGVEKFMTVFSIKYHSYKMAYTK